MMDGRESFEYTASITLLRRQAIIEIATKKIHLLYSSGIDTLMSMARYLDFTLQSGCLLDHPYFVITTGSKFLVTNTAELLGPLKLRCLINAYGYAPRGLRAWIS